MIEKKIHYIWFGGEKPEKVKKCIETWYKFLPDYKIIEWNETNIDIIKESKNNKFFKLCYKKKLWAFLSDYLRFKILLEEGGIYLDTDIQILKSLTPLLDTELFIGTEDDQHLSLGIIGSKKNHEFIKEIFNFYDKEIFNSKLYIAPEIVTMLYKRKYKLKKLKIGVKDKVFIWPKEYFYPYGYGEKLDFNKIDKKTYCIHLWHASWVKNPNILYLQYKHLNPIKRFFKIRKKIRKIKIENEKIKNSI